MRLGPKTVIKIRFHLSEWYLLPNGFIYFPRINGRKNLNCAFHFLFVRLEISRFIT